MSFNSAFDTFISGVFNGSIDMTSDDFRAYLFATGGGGGTTATFAFDKTLTGMNHPNIPTGQNRVGPVALTESINDTIFDMSPITFLSVPSGTVYHALLIYKHVTDGESDTDIPCLYYANNFAGTANGNNVIVSANAAAGLVSGQSQ